MSVRAVIMAMKAKKTLDAFVDGICKEIRTGRLKK